MKKLILGLTLAAPIILPLTATPLAMANSANSLERNISDSAITAKVKAKFAVDKALNPFDIAVFTHHRVVTLKGQVDADTEYEQAVTLAQSTTGVNDVEAEDLTVKDSRTPLKDLGITAKIKGKILKEKLFSSKKIPYWNISIETKNQVVYVKGYVASAKVENNILNILKHTDGVRSYVNLLKITG